MRRDKDLIDTILKLEPRFLNLKDPEGRTPVHYAASMGYVEEVRYLIGNYGASAIERDKNGMLQIHLVATEGHMQVIQELLQYCPDPREMLNDINDENILHIAAKTGKHNVATNILGNPALQCLINRRDSDLNPSLQLVTMNLDMKPSSPMTSEMTVDLKNDKNEGIATLDATDQFNKQRSGYLGKV
ncbi:hypothetical protein Ancab_007832 [Ancistrocladus abbreviatus]